MGFSSPIDWAASIRIVTSKGAGDGDVSAAATIVAPSETRRLRPGNRGKTACIRGRGDEIPTRRGRAAKVFCMLPSSARQQSRQTVRPTVHADGGCGGECDEKPG